MQDENSGKYLSDNTKLPFKMNKNNCILFMVVNRHEYIKNTPNAGMWPVTAKLEDQGSK